MNTAVTSDLHRIHTQSLTICRQVNCEGHIRAKHITTWQIGVWFAFCDTCQYSTLKEERKKWSWVNRESYILKKRQNSWHQPKNAKWSQKFCLCDFCLPSSFSFVLPSSPRLQVIHYVVNSESSFLLVIRWFFFFKFRPDMTLALEWELY